MLTQRVAARRRAVRSSCEAVSVRGNRPGESGSRGYLRQRSGGRRGRLRRGGGRGWVGGCACSDLGPGAGSQGVLVSGFRGAGQGARRGGEQRGGQGQEVGEGAGGLA